MVGGEKNVGVLVVTAYAYCEGVTRGESTRVSVRGDSCCGLRYSLRVWVLPGARAPGRWRRLTCEGVTRGESTRVRVTPALAITMPSYAWRHGMLGARMDRASAIPPFARSDPFDSHANTSCWLHESNGKRCAPARKLLLPELLINSSHVPA